MCALKNIIRWFQSGTKKDENIGSSKVEAFTRLKWVIDKDRRDI